MNYLLRPRIWPSFLASSGVGPCDVPFRHASEPRGTASRDPDNVPAKAGNQTPHDVIEHSLDSGSRPAKRRSSGMTFSANCDIVSKGGEIFAEQNK